MTVREAMEKRHMVRKYKDTVLPEEIVKKLNERIEALNKEHHLNLVLRTEDGTAFAELIDKLITKNAKNFIILAADPAEGVEEKIGYASADIMLYAQELGLNTWWVGASFNKDAVKKVGREIPAKARMERALSVAEYCLVAAMIPSGMEMSISKTMTIRPIQKEIPTTSVNFRVTGTVYFQLSPKSPRTALESHAKKPGTIPLSIP